MNHVHSLRQLCAYLRHHPGVIRPEVYCYAHHGHAARGWLGFVARLVGAL